MRGYQYKSCNCLSHPKYDLLLSIAGLGYNYHVIIYIEGTYSLLMTKITYPYKSMG